MAKREREGGHVPADMIERAGAAIMADPKRAARLAGTSIVDDAGNGFRVDDAGNVTRVRGGRPAPEAPTTDTEEC